MSRVRSIVHIDMDAFFAAVEERDHPEYRGKPIVVGAEAKQGKGRGVVSTASYAARRFGIHSAMPISQAYRACPSAIFLPVDMERYEIAASHIRRILYDFTPDIEPVSIDEAFLDITGSAHLFGGAVATCRLMKERIFRETGLTASVGLAPTKMAAKIASDLKKPDGFVEVTAEGLIDFLRPLPVRKLWGLGPKGEAVLLKRGIRTIADLAARDPAELKRLFGKSGLGLWELANGRDDGVVETVSETKSVSNEMTFEADTADAGVIHSVLTALSEKVATRLRHEALKGRTVTIKIRLEGFVTHTRSITLSAPTNFYEVIQAEVMKLYGGFDRCGGKVRLLGVKVSNFGVGYAHADLFSQGTDERREKREGALDRIRQRFGDGAIYRAGGGKEL